MGRESRQARRQRERRQQHKRQQAAGPSRWAIITGIGVIAAVIAVLAVFAIRNGQGSASGNNGSSTTVAAGKTIRGIQCNANEQLTYHVHGHLEFYVKGKKSEPPPYIGYDINHDCLYWVHTHDSGNNSSEGVLHVESPSKTEPTLGDFFAIWHQPLTSKKVWKYSVGPGQEMRVYKNEKLYSGNPAAIKILPHTDITIEIGPPFVQPKPFNYKAQQL
jgi:hypothetical protein